MAHWLLDWAAAQCDGAGLRTVLLTRGYKAHPPHLPYFVSPESPVEEAGDEPLMLAQQHPQAQVVVDPVRSRAAAVVEQTICPDLYVLDDAFQHLAIQRDVDLVLLTPQDLTTEWNRVIPAGSWRESASALTRAHAFLIKVAPKDVAALEQAVQHRLGRWDTPVFSFSLYPSELHRVGDVPPGRSVGQREGRNAQEISGGLCDISPQELAASGYVLFSGVGCPEQVSETVTEFFGVPPARHHVFIDHHTYVAEDIHRMVAGGMPLVCTPKDAVKVARLPESCRRNVWTFRLETRFGPAWKYTGTFLQWWEASWRALARTKG